jgi:excisionase family DNA binding protein
MLPENWRSRTVLTVGQAAEALGVSRATAYRGVRDGSIPSLHIAGRTVRVPVVTLLAMLEGRAER